MAGSCYYARITHRDSPRPLSRIRGQESENERVAGSPESVRLVRDGIRSFRRLPGDRSFRRARPVWRSSGSTFLCGLHRPTDGLCHLRRGRDLPADRHRQTAGASKSLSHNGQRAPTERRGRSLQRPGLPRPPGYRPVWSRCCVLLLLRHIADLSTHDGPLDGTRRPKISRRLPSRHWCVKLA
jgi:hypothetical protein